MIKNNLDTAINKYTKAVIVYFTIYFISQMVFSTMWAGGLSKIDLFQLIIAPSCCVAIAAIFGWYKNEITTIISSTWVLLISAFFYSTFQMFTFFKGSNYESLMKMNFIIMGKQAIFSAIISAVIIAFICFFNKNK